MNNRMIPLTSMLAIAMIALGLGVTNTANAELKVEDVCGKNYTSSCALCVSIAWYMTI